jgi:hypothetical protein
MNIIIKTVEPREVLKNKKNIQQKQKRWEVLTNKGTKIVKLGKAKGANKQMSKRKEQKYKSKNKSQICKNYIYCTQMNLFIT